MHQQHTYAKHVVSIAHRQATVHMICPHDGGDTFRRLRGIVRLSLRDQSRFRDSLAHEVVVSNTAFTEFRISCRAASCDYDRRQSLPEKFIGVIKAGPEYW